jgi:mannosylglycoprotein endo-beta-mannosidase
MAQFVILQLDIAQESRTLSDDEYSLRAKLKKRVLGLAVLKRFRKRQCSRLSNLKLGDANTCFFHLKANSRRRKNFISKLRSHSGKATTHQEKSSVAQSHYEAVLGPPPSRELDFNWQLFRQPVVDLSSLDADFTEDEVKRALKLMPKDKAPGPDGFSIIFFVKCGDIIKGGHNESRPCFPQRPPQFL